MKRHTVGLGIIALLVLAGALVTAGAAATPVKTLATPKLLTPMNKAVIAYDPAGTTVTFDWKPVSGAVWYRIELEKGTLIDKNQYRWDPFLFDHPLTPSYSFDFVTPSFAGTYRWRVTAEDPDFHFLNSPPSPWRTFSLVTPGA